MSFYANQLVSTQGLDTCTHCRIATHFWFQERSSLPFSKYLLRANQSQGNTFGTVETEKERAQALQEVCQLDRVACEEEILLREQGWAAMEPALCLPATPLEEEAGCGEDREAPKDQVTAPALPVKIDLSLNSREE